MSVLFQPALPVGVAAGGSRPTGSSAARPSRLKAARRRRLDRVRAADRRAERRRGAARAQGRHGARRRARHVSVAAGGGSRSGGRPAICSKASPIGATATRRWSGSIRRTGCCSTSPAARICSAARRRSPAIWSRGWRSRACAPAPRSPTRSAAPGASRAMASRASCRAARPKAAMLPLPVAALRIDAEIVAELKTSGLDLRRRSHVARPRAPFAARFGKELLLPSRSGAGPCRRADHAAPAGAGGDGRAALSRSDRARGRRARHHRASGAPAWPPCWSGAARAGGCSRWRCFAPTARCIGSRSAPARRCAIRRACASCSRSGSPCWATPAIRASATTWCGSRRWSPSAPIRRRPGLAGGDHAEELAHLIDRLGARFGLAPRDAARAAGHAHSGICGGGGAGACG